MSIRFGQLILMSIIFKTTRSYRADVNNNVSREPTSTVLKPGGSSGALHFHCLGLLCAWQTLHRRALAQRFVPAARFSRFCNYFPEFEQTRDEGRPCIVSRAPSITCRPICCRRRSAYEFSCNRHASRLSASMGWRRFGPEAISTSSLRSESHAGSL